MRLVWMSYSRDTAALICFLLARTSVMNTCIEAPPWTQQMPHQVSACILPCGGTSWVPESKLNQSTAQHLTNIGCKGEVSPTRYQR